MTRHRAVPSSRRARLAGALVVAGAVAASATGLLARSSPRSDGGGVDGPGGARVDPTVLDAATIARGELPAADRPPEPVQWAGPAGAVPAAQWWSGALVGPGTRPLWPHPLAVQVAPDGTVAVSAERRVAHADGSSSTPFVPRVRLAVTFDPRVAAATAPLVRVVDAGPLHVRVRVGDDDAGVTLTLVEGSPFVELAVRHASVRVLASSPPAPPVPVSPPARHDDVATLAVDGRDWTLAASDGALALDGSAPLDGPGLAVVARGSQAATAALGPTPDGVAAGRWAELAAGVARHPVAATGEELQVAGDGSVRQRLRVDRGGASSVLALAPHQAAALDAASARAEPAGTIDGSLGPQRLVVAGSIAMTYPAVPVLWAPVSPSPDGAWASSLADDAGRPPAGTGSYFGAKASWYDALLVDLARAAGRDAPATPASRLRERLDALVSTAEPALAHDARWGSVVVTPAEFGSGRELNDHSLQYGYWVAAASVLAEADPAWAGRHRAAIDLLVADYAGAATLAPAIEGRGLAPWRTWDPYLGHSLASGTAPFADGNNLESSSEAAFAWWAAARWFVVTGRPALAEPFVARFAVETTVARATWLAPAGASGRPWLGVVWSSKADLGTWFDASPEAALGIQLLPLGPNSLARYAGSDARARASARWSWCEHTASACTAMWPNLLASDAVVAGRTLDAAPGAAPEPSTGATVLSWWRSVWQSRPRLDTPSCTPGAVLTVTRLLAANPGPAPLTVRCLDREKNVAYRYTVAPGERASLPLGGLTAGR